MIFVKLYTKIAVFLGLIASKSDNNCIQLWFHAMFMELYSINITTIAMYYSTVAHKYLSYPEIAIQFGE